MTLATSFTELVGCQFPVQQAGMGGASTPELAAAVSNAGGLGMLTVSGNVLADVRTALAAAPGRPVGINFLMPFFEPALLEAVAPLVRLVDWFWGQPDPELVGITHDAGALAAGAAAARIGTRFVATLAGHV